MRRRHRDAAAFEVLGDHAREQSRCPRRRAPSTGSSRIHSGRGASDSRARPMRRRCPCDSTRAGQRALARQARPRRARADGLARRRFAGERNERGEVLLGGELVLERRRDGRRTRSPRAADRTARPCLPFQRISPDSGVDRPASMRSSVVLPVPLAPVTTSACPASTLNESPANSRAKPRRAARSWASSIE